MPGGLPHQKTVPNPVSRRDSHLAGVGLLVLAALAAAGSIAAVALNRAYRRSATGGP